MSAHLAAVLSRHADIRRPLLRARVVDLSRWSDTGPSFVGCLIGGATRQVIYRDGPNPRIGDYLPVIRMNAHNGDYLALPLAKLIILRMVYPFTFPAFDNTWYKANYLGIGVAAHHPDDPEFVVVLGRRNDNSWVIRANYPHDAASYAAQSDGGLRDTMRVRYTKTLNGFQSLPNNVIATYAYPDDGSDPGMTPNVYTSNDDGENWVRWTFMQGLVDEGILGNFHVWLIWGGTGFGYFSSVVSGDPRLGGTFQLIQITGRHWRWCFDRQLEQVQTFPTILVAEILVFLGPAGMTVFEFYHPSGIGSTRSLPIHTWVYGFPEVTDCPWEGMAWIAGGTIGTVVDDVCYWLPGRNRDRSPVKIYQTLVTNLRGGTPVWTVAVDPTVPFTFDPASYDDDVVSETTLHQEPNLWGIDNTDNIWPMWKFTNLGFTFVTNLATGTEDAFTPPGATAGAFPPPLRLSKVQGFEQFREHPEDAFVFKLTNHAFAGPDPGGGATFNGDGFNGGQSVPGGRVFAMYENFVGDAVPEDSTGTLIEDTGQEGAEYALWGEYAYSIYTGIDQPGVNSVWWDVVPDEE